MKKAIAILQERLDYLNNNNYPYMKELDDGRYARIDELEEAIAELKSTLK
jgi:hypothetical protein